jgi:cysteine desulfurase
MTCALYVCDRLVWLSARSLTKKRQPCYRRKSDNLAIHLALQSFQEHHHDHARSTNESNSSSNSCTTTKHVITSNVEHPAILACLERMQDQGIIQVTAVPVQPDGRVRASDVMAAVEQWHGSSDSQQTKHVVVLVTLMMANNESGALQPVKAVAEYCRERCILFHTDAAQASGKVGIRLAEDLGGADMVTLVGHKLGAPKGVACLYVRPGCLEEGGRRMHHHGVLLIGGGQEHGRRGGTENVPFIVGLGEAAAVAARELRTNARHMESLRSRLLDKLTQGLGEENVRANGPLDPAFRLPNTLSVGLKGVHSGDLLASVGDRVAASASAACHSATGVSTVLKAMNVPPDFMCGTVRLSVGPHNTAAEVDEASEILIQAAKEQFSFAPPWLK